MELNLQSEIINLSEKMHNRIKDCSNIQEIPTTGYNWENYRYSSPYFRQAHVEVFSHNALIVLHVVVLPDVKYPAPIFGFDIVGSSKSNTVSGLFLDWSPTRYDVSWHDTTHHESNRILPEWSHIFSKQFIASRPDDNLSTLLTFTELSFERYLRMLESSIPVVDNHDIIQKQTEYCDVQSSNPRTHAALSAHLQDSEHATYFMTNILFPKPENKF